MNSKDELYYSAINLLHRLIGTPSISREEDAAAQIICETLQKNRFTPYRAGNNVWTFAREFDSEKPTVLLNSHIDTVKPTDSWSRPPFVPIEEDNRLYGLGSNDAGASVVSLLSAFIHLSETEKEQRECIERHGLTPTQLFEENGLFEHGGGGFHCVWFDETDMDIFARRGLYAVTCPASNAKLARGIAPVSEFLRRKIPLAIGTDGPASNNALNMFREMYLAAVLQKLREEDAASCDAREILRAACSTGARAMRIDADCIAPGKLADLVVIDLHQANMQPEHNTVKNLVYSGSNSNVLLTMVNGKILYENGVYHVGESPEDIVAHARAATERIINS